MNQTPYMNTTRTANVEVVNAFMRGIYGWMSAGLAITAVLAYLVTTSSTLLNLFFNVDPVSGSVGLSMFYIVMIVAEFGIVMALSWRISRMNPTTATGLFLAYSALNGLTLAPILLVYTAHSVAVTFFVTAGMFGAMSLYGLLTKKDLTSMGSLLFMGLIGMLIAMVVNMFLHSAMMDFVISGVGVILFLGLTAFDTQKLKTMGEVLPNDAAAIRRGSIMGALTLYLDFINLFLFLLRFLGNRE